MVLGFLSRGRAGTIKRSGFVGRHSMSSVFYRAPGQAYPRAVRGEGVYLWDADGQKYLDGSGGAAISCGFVDGGGGGSRSVDHGDGSYSLTWSTHAPGDFAAFVKLDGIHVLGSPLQLPMCGTPAAPVRARRAHTCAAAAGSRFPGRASRG